MACAVSDELIQAYIVVPGSSAGTPKKTCGMNTGSLPHPTLSRDDA